MVIADRMMIEGESVEVLYMESLESMYGCRTSGCWRLRA